MVAHYWRHIRPRLAFALTGVAFHLAIPGSEFRAALKRAFDAYTKDLGD